MGSSTKRAERLRQACDENSLTGKDYGIPFPTEKLAFKSVYKVPIKILSFNFDNGRIASEKITKESQRGKKFNPNSEEDQKLVGEILLTSMDKDGTKSGFDIELLKVATNILQIPVIASGGVGTKEHFFEGVFEGGASALLAASVFHFNEFSIKEVKQFLSEKNIKVRF